MDLPLIKNILCWNNYVRIFCSEVYELLLTKHKRLEWALETSMCGGFVMCFFLKVQKKFPWTKSKCQIEFL